jgi:alpha-1,6-mannosyltransferase
MGIVIEELRPFKRRLCRHGDASVVALWAPLPRNDTIHRFMTKRLFVLGILLLGVYVSYVLSLHNPRVHDGSFEQTFFISFALYAYAVWLILQGQQLSTTRQIMLIFAFGIAFRAVLVFSHPDLSSDMYRYVWDGRVQANGINPYLYPPDASEVAHLRDETIWPLINRKGVVTVYPAGAELAYAALWRIWPDNIHWFQTVMAAGDLLAGALLVALLRALGQNPLTVLIYLWSPLVIVETAHSAHVDGLVLPLLVGAWLSRVKGRDGLTGLLLGVAAAVKLYPILLLPILWRAHDSEGRFRPALSTPLAFLAGFLIPYIPYLSVGKGVIGFLPSYLKEQFNPGLAFFIGLLVKKAGGNPEQVILILLFGTLVVIYCTLFYLRPPADGAHAIRRCIWPIGAFTLLTQNLFPWYMLWLVPLLAIFLPASSSNTQTSLGGFPRSSWTGWWLFCCLISLSYPFFVPPGMLTLRVLASVIQFLPLYVFLVYDVFRWLWKRRQSQTDLISNREAI